MAELRQVERPLSPHLQIYRFTITMAMSILHRITGAALYFGTALLAWWLIAAASGPASYGFFQQIAGSIFGQIVLFGYTWALVHHLFSGIRYLFWDAIIGFDNKTADAMSWASLVLGLLVTLGIWAFVFYLRGAF